ncbi:DUF1016 family protein [filamentous cyanobacterium LEGE 11480]|uniref:DUF1016 family protein n=1 Tax=Romeriopsis navalis LEGE 11480 TaxID=2777977 RepID=A0A928Z645_9CYAN|nr:PDDEXK nuclease domain-containing protein [Romeriopsis navalis]MBE9033439.1 DUF1016 family protein [Romeriopsis navalis LEGE 11480]
MPKSRKISPDDQNYGIFLDNLKTRIRQAQIKAALAINQELILLYWQIGREILQRQNEQGWGGKVVVRLAQDLKREFPDMKGFSRTNLMYMRAFADTYPDEQFIHQLGGQIPWKHNCILLDRVKSPQERIWYIQKTIANGWSRNILEMQIESGLYHRQGGAITNFERTLPPEHSDLSRQLLKDPYNFDFLTLQESAKERDLERGLLEHIRDFLIELGVGFAFLGSQYPIVVDEKEYRIDMLFYHTQLHCYVVIDLKMGEFEPEYSGKMNFYVEAVNNLLRQTIDSPTIGIVLCRSKRKTVVEYALGAVNNPIGVASYELQDNLPPDFQSRFPSVEQLEMEVEAAIADIKGETEA